MTNTKNAQAHLDFIIDYINLTGEVPYRKSGDDAKRAINCLTDHEHNGNVKKSLVRDLLKICYYKGIDPTQTKWLKKVIATYKIRNMPTASHQQAQSTPQQNMKAPQQPPLDDNIDERFAVYEEALAKAKRGKKMLEEAKRLREEGERLCEEGFKILPQL